MLYNGSNLDGFRFCLHKGHSAYVRASEGNTYVSTRARRPLSSSRSKDGEETMKRARKSSGRCRLTFSPLHPTMHAQQKTCPHSVTVGSVHSSRHNVHFRASLDVTFSFPSEG